MILNTRSRGVSSLCFLWPLFSVNFAHGRTPPSFTPSTSNMLNVTFNGNIKIYPGQSLQPPEAWSLPKLSSVELEIHEPHIAIMIDIEIINDGVAYPMLHWYQADLWVNVQTTDSILQNFTNTGAEYVGPQPNPGPSHTYVLLLFRQPLNFRFPPCYNSILPLSVEARRGLDLHDFLDVAGLTEVVAANYFMCQDPRSRPTSTFLNRRPCATHTFGVSGPEKLHGDL